MGLPEGQHEAAPTPTPVGGRSFASPAMVRILLAPAGPDVTPAEFDKWSAAVRNWESVKLTELPKSQTGRPGPGESLSWSFLSPSLLRATIPNLSDLGIYSDGQRNGEDGRGASLIHHVL